MSADRTLKHVAFWLGLYTAVLFVCCVVLQRRIERDERQYEFGNTWMRIHKTVWGFTDER